MSTHPLESVDPAAVRGSATALLGLAEVLDECASGYEQLHDHRWSGPAADAARRRLDLFVLPLRASSRDLRAAAGALIVHADVLDEALVHLRAARREEQRYEAAVAAEVVAHPDPARLDSLTAHPAAETSGARPEVVRALRAAAEDMVERSARAAASVLLDVGSRAPTVQRTPVTGPERLDHWVDEHGGARVDTALDVAGEASLLDATPLAATPVGAAAGVVGTGADLVHTGLNVVRGRWADAATSLVAAIPVVGDAVHLADSPAPRLARLGRMLKASEEPLDAVDGAYSRGTQLTDAIGEAGGAIDAARAPHTGLVDGSYEQVHTTALAARAGLPHGPLPSQTLVTALLAGGTARYRPATDPRTGRVPRALGTPTRWVATAEVEQQGRVVTYEMTLGPGTAGRPQAVRSRPVPRDVERGRRAWAYDAGPGPGPWPVAP